MIMISACLLGLNTKYNGDHNTNPALIEFCQHTPVIPVCPEQLGGLPTPRPPAEIYHGDGTAVLKGEARVLTSKGQDITSRFIKGAKETWKIVKFGHVQAAIFKARSPSCGCHYIYDGTFTHTQKTGDGVTTALLRAHGLPVYSEEDVTPGLLGRFKKR